MPIHCGNLTSYFHRVLRALLAVALSRDGDEHLILVVRQPRAKKVALMLRPVVAAPVFAVLKKDGVSHLSVEWWCADPRRRKTAKAPFAGESWGARA